MKQTETQTIASFSRWNTPNPFKHGKLVSSDQGKKRVVTHERQPVTADLISGHLSGTHKPIGYLAGSESGTHVGAIDLDGKDFPGGIEEAKEAVVKAALDAGLKPFIERSLSGKGYHIWLYADAEIPYKNMMSALKQVVRLAGLPISTETYPMGAEATSRWIFMPYAGALRCPRGLGSTYLVDADGENIALTELDNRLQASDVSVFRALGDSFTRETAKVPKSEKANLKPTGQTTTMSSAAVDHLCQTARQRAPKKRHDTLMAFLNLAHQAHGLAQVAESLKQKDVYDLWCTDGSRTVQDWKDEIDRLVEHLHSNTDETRPARGIPSLVEEGFDVSGLHLARGDKAENGDNDKRSSVSTRVLELVLEAGSQPWHDETGTAYLSIVDGEQLEHYRLPSRGAEDYITEVFYDAEARPLSSQALNEVLAVLKTLARRKGPEFPTGVRVKFWDGKLYLDLGRPDWKIVEVSVDGWQIILAEACPVRFTRANHMLPLPIPVFPGRLDDIPELLNVNEAGRILTIAFLLAALAARGPYPHLALKGEQGVGKSTAATTLQRLIDPSTATRRRAPRKEQDLYIAAQGAHVLNLDNLSTITTDLSDTLCCFSTGGSFATRTLHSNDEETVLQAKRPIILNGIADLLNRADLAERTLAVELQRIDPSKRLTEEELEKRFIQSHPEVLGGLLTALATGLARMPETHLERPPRLADFAKLIVAAEPALPWKSGEFMKVYTAMQDEAACVVLEGDEVAEALCAFLDERGQWEGPVNRLLNLLNEQEGFMSGQRRFPYNWPKNARGFGERLRRMAPALSKVGYTTFFLGRKKDGLYYHLQKIESKTFTTDIYAK